MLVRTPASLKRSTTCVKNSIFGPTIQPLVDVMASGASGTSVTYSGFTSQTSSINSGEGYPSMLNSVFTSGRRA